MSRLGAGILAVAAATALIGCTSAKDARRHAVNRYVQRVNGIEMQQAAAWQRAQIAYRGLGTGAITPAKLRALASAPVIIRALRGRVAAVEAPPVVAGLRASLLHLLDEDARFADEVSRFGIYVVGVGKLEQELGAKTTLLRRTLARERHPSAEEKALRGYAVQLSALGQRIDALHAPRALAPWHKEELRRIHALRTAAVQLAAGIASRDGNAEARALTMFRSAAASSTVSEADRAAIVAYDRRLTDLGRLGAEVARRQAALSKAYS